MDVDAKLAELYIDLPEPGTPPQGIAHAVKSGKVLYIGGAFPFAEGRLQAKGRVGVELRLEAARAAARLACIQALAVIARECEGTLNRVKRIIRLDGFIAASADFQDHHKVMEGASELLLTLFGSSGVHARTAVGVSCLPLNACIELVLVVEVK